MRSPNIIKATSSIAHHRKWHITPLTDIIPCSCSILPTRRRRRKQPTRLNSTWLRLQHAHRLLLNRHNTSPNNMRLQHLRKRSRSKARSFLPSMAPQQQ
jgi:hypothetical protein